MKKKIFLIVSLCMLVFGLSACGEDPKKVDTTVFPTMN